MILQNYLGYLAIGTVFINISFLNKINLDILHIRVHKLYNIVSIINWSKVLQSLIFKCWVYIEVSILNKNIPNSLIKIRPHL